MVLMRRIFQRLRENVSQWIQFRPRIGLTVTSDAVGAVVVRRSAVAWSGLDPVGVGETRGAVIARMLQRLRSHGHWSWGSPKVWVVVDLPQSRVKTIRGLPPVDDVRVVAHMLAATPERFFLGSSHGVIPTGVRVLAPGVVEAAVFDIAILDEIQAACVAAGFQTTLFVPATVAVMAAPRESEVGQIPEALRPAYGAPYIARHEPLVVRHVRSGSSPASASPKRRLVWAGVTALLSVSTAALAPVGVALRTSRTARHTIATLAPVRANALTVEREVAAMTAAVAAVTRFERHRVSKTLLLAQLTQALPETAVITTLTIDTTGTTVIVLAPRAADVVQGIEEMTGVSHVEILGPVTQEGGSPPSPQSPGSPAGAELERVTVRFQLTADGPPARRPLAPDIVSATGDDADTSVGDGGR